MNSYSNYDTNQQKGQILNNNNSKPSSSHSNRPFQSISFRNNGTPQQNNTYLDKQYNINMNQQRINQNYPLNNGYSQTPQNGGYPNDHIMGSQMQMPSSQRDNVKFVYNKQQD